MKLPSLQFSSEGDFISKDLPQLSLLLIMLYIYCCEDINYSNRVFHSI